LDFCAKSVVHAVYVPRIRDEPSERAGAMSALALGYSSAYRRAADNA